MNVARRYIVLLALILVAIGGAWLIGGSLVSQAFLDRAYKVMNEAQEDAPALESRFPRTRTSASAEELVRIAAQLGISFGQGHQVVGSPPAQARSDFSEIEPMLRTWIETVSSNTNPATNPIPERIKDFLQASEPLLDQLNNHVSSSGALLWDLDFSKGMEFPLPPFSAGLRNSTGFSLLTRC